MLTELVQQLAGMVGVAMLIAFLVNAGKQFGLVKDTDAPIWVAACNGIVLLALYVVGAFKVQVDLPAVDNFAAVLAVSLTPVVILVAALLASRLTHVAIRGVPVIGYSFSFLQVKAAVQAAAMNSTGVLTPSPAKKNRQL